MFTIRHRKNCCHVFYNGRYIDSYLSREEAMIAIRGMDYRKIEASREKKQNEKERSNGQDKAHRDRENL